MTQDGKSPANDLADLLRQWSDAQMSRVTALDRVVEPAFRAGSVLLPPATEAEVVAAEQRLGVRLPASYRQFLLISNGAYADTVGPVWEDDPDPGRGFLPVAELEWFNEVDPLSVQIWTSTQDEIDAAIGSRDLASTYDGGEVMDYRPIRDALLIARGFDAGCSLLVPVGGRDADEWEVWDHDKEGSTRWASFRAHVHAVVEDHLGVDVDEAEALLLLANAEQGDGQAMQRLGRVRSPEAADLLMDAARRGVEPTAVLPALARIGGDEVTRALIDLKVRPWEQTAVHLALAQIGTREALDHLAEVGAVSLLADAGDPRAADIAHRQLFADDYSNALGAARLLYQLPDERWVPGLFDAYDRHTGDEIRACILSALEVCGAATAEIRRRVPDLLDGPYSSMGRGISDRLDSRDAGEEPSST